MPKLKNRPPKQSWDKGTAVVYCGGEKHSLGKWGSKEADANYRRFVAEWATGATPFQSIGEKHFLKNCFSSF